ncbi:helix-turn-helix transcriptional regulator [Pelagibius litoralis]|uniref:helix-turn-helix transcriptional regulator n=1 Tax=Pelagibius litoralis TaxID=374515 RepID=UPI00197D3C4A|nr:helix-turn-helix transcriptional regulator [Pelagibius litoralis]
MDLIIITRHQCKAARALVEMKQVDLAEAAGVSKQTLVDFERGARTPHRNHIVAIRTALETAGVVFIDPNGGGPGVRLRE